MAKLLAMLAVLALVAAACGDDSDDDSASGDTSGETTAEGGGDAGAGMKACMVSDTGGIDDRSFNQTSWEGFQQAEEELGVEVKFLESTSEADFTPNIQAFLDEGCDIITTVGFLLGDATAEAAAANPDQSFSIIDFVYEEAEPNILQTAFQTDEAAFLAGYLAAGMTETGTIGTFGGINIPTVSIFMEGFRNGAIHYNDVHETDVEVLGWDGSDGLFTGDFEDQDKGAQTTQTLIDEGADIIMPVAGPVGLGSIAPAREAGAKMIWVDTDGCVSVPDACDLFLTSVMKGLDVAAKSGVEQVVDGSFAGGLYTGTLENGGVQIAPYHDFEDQVPDDLKAEIDELSTAISGGEQSVGAMEEAG